MLFTDAMDPALITKCAIVIKIIVSYIELSELIFNLSCYTSFFCFFQHVCLYFLHSFLPIILHVFNISDHIIVIIKLVLNLMYSILDMTQNLWTFIPYMICVIFFPYCVHFSQLVIVNFVSSLNIFLEIISGNRVCFFHEITAKIIGPRLASFFSSHFPFTFINWLKIEESFMKVFGELLLQLWWGWKSLLSNIHTTRIHA